MMQNLYNQPCRNFMLANQLKKGNLPIFTCLFLSLLGIKTVQKLTFNFEFYIIYFTFFGENSPLKTRHWMMVTLAASQKFIKKKHCKDILAKNFRKRQVSCYIGARKLGAS